MEEYPRVVYGHDSSGGPQCPRVDANGIVDVRLKGNDAALAVTATPAGAVSGWKTATITIATDDDLSDAVDLGDHYRYLAAILPTLTSARVGIHVCATAAGTYVPLGPGVAAQTDLTTGGYATVFDIGGWRYIKLSTSVAQGDNRAITVQGVRG